MLTESCFKCFLGLSNVLGPFALFTLYKVNDVSSLTVMMFLYVHYFVCVCCFDGFTLFYKRTNLATLLAFEHSIDHSFGLYIS